MDKEKVRSYADFWETLLPSYPISKGSMRLPVVTELIEIPDFNLKKFTENLKQILEELVKNEGTKEKAIERAKSASDEKITPLINEEYTGIVRFDCLWNPNTNSVSILEINCDYPDGLLLHDKTYSTLARTETTLHKKLLNQLFGDHELISILHSPDAVFVDSYEVESQNLKDINLGGERVTTTDNLGSKQAIRRCLETTKMSADMINNLSNKEVRSINTLALRTLGYKDLLGSINHPYVPKTILVSHESIDYVNKNREHLILKPANGCEGHGIFFGNKINAIEWSKLVSGAVEKNYIAQELIHIPQMKVSLYEENTIIEKVLYYDLCPHFFIKDGQVIGTGHTLMRFSENPIVNVTQGGGIGYYKL